jgi:hypothetical protein
METDTLTLYLACTRRYTFSSNSDSSSVPSAYTTGSTNWRGADQLFSAVS